MFLLKIYGLYKYATVSARPKPGSRPSMFDWTGSAKWDAWDGTLYDITLYPCNLSSSVPQAAGKKYTSNEVVEARYIEIAQLLGWPGVEIESPPDNAMTAKESLAEILASGPSRKPNDEIDLDNLSDGDDDTMNQGQRGGGGMGVKVSTLKEGHNSGVDESIHSYVISGDVDKVREALGRVDVDGRDQYVSGGHPLESLCY